MKIIEQLYIDGKWIEPQSKKTLKVINPGNEQIIATVPAASKPDVVKAINAARAAFKSWKTSSPQLRREILEKIALKMEERSEELARAISESMGCPLQTARWLQVDDAISVIRNFSELTYLTEDVEEIGNSLILSEPIGVCAFINPWNFPLYQLVAKVGAALAVGCTMVVKPSEQTPLQDVIFAEIVESAGVPNGVFNLITGTGIEIGTVLSSHPSIDMVSFTGSTNTGALISKQAADTVKRVTLELGGKSPLIITEDANLETAVSYGINDLMLNSGQVCTALSRMLVPSHMLKHVEHLLVESANKLTIGTQDDADIGPLSSLQQWENVQAHIARGIDDGATLIVGGLGKPEGLDTGYFARPTIFSKVDNAMTIAREEIFGPVLCLIPYNEIDEAISIANDSPYGLNSAVYAGTKEVGIEIARKIEAGMCHVNGGELNLKAPFGGVKHSGNGRELSHHGLQEFIELKSVQLPSL